MNEYAKICMIKCKEKDVLHNLNLLINNDVRALPHISLMCSNKYFYFFIADLDEIKNLDIKGQIIIS